MKTDLGSGISLGHWVSSTRLRTGLRLRWLLAALAVLTLVSAPAQTGIQMFMKIGGQATTMGSTQGQPTLQGESTDTQYPKWTEIMSMSHGISLPVTIGSGGTSIGKSVHLDPHVEEGLDKTGPAINLLTCGSTTGLTVSLPIDYVTIDFRTIGANPIVFYRVELQGVYFTSVNVSASGTVPTQQLSMTYQKIRWTFVPYASGKAGAPVTTGWDIVKNVAL